MRKGQLPDMWLMIGVLIMIFVLALLLVFQQSANNAWKPVLVPGTLFFRSWKK